jgi:hypothetical protein
MLKPSIITALIFLVFCGALALVPSSIQSHVVALSNTPAVIEAAEDNSNYYTARADMRKCASPMCGGYFIKSVNQAMTTCADGRSMAECYIASIDWNGADEVELSRALIRGTLDTKDDRRGKFGVLKVSEVWQAFSDKPAEGDFYRVRDLGLRCIAAPCETHSEVKLNSTTSRHIAGVNLPTGATSKDQMDQISRAMTSDEGILVAGSLSDVSGPAGKSKALNASQFYLRNNPTTALKPCIKTGCSGEICADEEMMSTCVYRAEYACYKKAVCERQPGGNCGFTKTTALTTCIARTKRTRR